MSESPPDEECGSLNIPFSFGDKGAQPGTYIRDAVGRLIAYRTARSLWIVELLVDIGQNVVILVQETYLDEKKRKGNNRGPHYFSIFGIDRQNKIVSHSFLRSRI